MQDGDDGNLDKPEAVSLGIDPLNKPWISLFGQVLEEIQIIFSGNK